MTEVMIKPLRTYEDRGEIRRRGGAPYPAPSSLAKELVSLGLCALLEKPAATEAEPIAVAIKELGRGNWVLVDADGSRVGEFSGVKKAATEELARLLEEQSKPDEPPAKPVEPSDPPQPNGSTEPPPPPQE